MIDPNSIQTPSQVDRILLEDLSQAVLHPQSPNVYQHLTKFLNDWGRFMVTSPLIEWSPVGLNSLESDLPVYNLWPDGIEFRSSDTEGYFILICGHHEIYQLSLLRNVKTPDEFIVNLHRKQAGEKPRQVLLFTPLDHKQLPIPTQQQVTSILKDMFHLIPGTITQRGYDPFYL
jgi:hypothetical protein